MVSMDKELKKVPNTILETVNKNDTINLKSLYESLDKYQLLHCHLFLRFL